MNPDSASSRPATRRGNGTTRSTENTAAASVDGHDGAEQQRQLPVHPEQQVRPGGRDHHADRDADGGQHARGRQHPSHVAEPRRQTAFDQDDRQRDRAEVVGEQVVLELQSQPVFADDDPDPQEQQQARQADPGGRPGGDDAGQQHEPTGQQHQIQLLQGHFIPQLTSRRRRMGHYDSCSESEGGPSSVATAPTSSRRCASASPVRGRSVGPSPWNCSPTATRSC